MFTLEAGKSSVSGDIDMEDAKDIGNRLGKNIKEKNYRNVQNCNLPLKLLKNWLFIITCSCSLPS
jgi:hypothetical protein